MAVKRLICLVLIFGLVLSTTGVAEVSKKQQSNMRFRPGKRNKVRDISIVQLRIEPTQFKVGDRVHVLVNVANSSEISVNNVSIELKVRGTPIGRKNITTIAPGQIVETDFTCIIGKRKSELIEIAAIIKPIEVKKRPKGKIKKVRYNYLYNAEGDVGILYKVEPPVHQWIAFQAYNKLPTGTLKSEMNSYLPTSGSSSYYSSSFSPPSGWENDDNSPYVSSEALIEGAWEEDKGFAAPGVNRWWRHYWSPDGGYNDGLWASDSALKRAQEDDSLWQDAIDAYNEGTEESKALAYYRLGRVAHLLMDMSVPAHTLLDEHPFEDRYEEFTGDNYKNITSSSPNTGIPSGLPSYPQSTPPSYDNDLTKLFYNLAEKSDDFDSDDEDGESTDYGNGKYTWGRNALDASKTFSRAEYFVWTLLSGWEKERDLVRYVDYDIFRSCVDDSQYHIYYYWSFYDEYNNSLTHWVKVYYTDGSSEFVDWDLEELGGVPDSVLECIYQPELQARAVGYVAALYQLFWDSVEHPNPDLNGDRFVNFKDFAILARRWLETCSAPNWCEGADLDWSGKVNYSDLQVLAGSWLYPDAFPQVFETPTVVPGLEGYTMRASDITKDGSLMLLTIWDLAHRLYYTTWNPASEMWNTPQDMGFNNWDGMASLSPDEGTMYYSNHGVLYKATGSPPASPPGTLISQPTGTERPYFNGDRLYFHRGPENHDIWYCEYNSGSGEFGPDLLLSEISTSNWNEVHPYITPNGQTLLFSTNWPDGYNGLNNYGGWDIYKARWNGSQSADITNLGPQINTAGDEGLPFYCPSTTTLYFTRDGTLMQAVPERAGSVAYWPFDEGSGNVATMLQELMTTLGFE